MRETNGRQRRVSVKVRAAVAALLAIFAFGVVNATSAQAGERLDVTFDDAWIKLPALENLGLKPVHALDPSDGKNLTVAMGGTLDPATGAFSSKAADFTFPQQVFEVTPGNDVTLTINALNDFTGNYNKASGAFNLTLPLKLTVDAPGFGVKCELRPLTIPLSSSGGAINFAVDADPPNPKAGAAFAAPGNNGAVNGSWSNVTANNNVYGIAAYAKDQATMTSDCKNLIEGLVGDGDTSFDGSIWLAGTSKVTTTVDPTCAADETGTYPDCVKIAPPPPPPAGAAKITKVKAKPGKLVIKRKKTGVLKVKVTNGGDQAATGVKVCAKAPGKLVKKAKCAKIKTIAAGKTATAKLKFKAKKKKGKGKIKITVKSENAGKKTAKAKLKVK